MFRHTKQFLFVLAILTTAGVVVACTKADSLAPLKAVLNQSITASQVQVNFCTDPAVTPKQTLKMLIVLDHSGSNKLNYQMSTDGTGAPAIVGGQLIVGTQFATDPTGVTRYGNVNTSGTLLNYLANVPANDPLNPSRYFALVDFSDSVDTYPTNSSGFTSDTVDFFNHVQSDATAGSSGTTPDDGGSTDYIKALDAVYNIINGDVTNAKNCAKLTLGSASPGAWCPTPGVAVASAYTVIFMSDGAPITSIQNVTVQNGVYVVSGQLSYTIESASQIYSQVATIQGLTQNSDFVTSVNFFPIYYYNPTNIDADARVLLSNMAKAGNGVFYDVQAGSNLDYTQFQPPVKKIQYSLADVFVTNANITWWNDGVLHYDADMDGLPDDIEIAWGSSPAKSSTQNNGVSDLVRYRLSGGAACTTMGSGHICADPAINYVGGACSSVSHSTVSGTLTFTSSDPNGLNDCEKVALSDLAGVNNPDSNSDLIPDFLEFMANTPFQSGSSPAVNMPDQDGYSVYQKIKYSLPQSMSVHNELTVSPSRYQLNLVSTGDQNCYNLVVQGLPILGPNNTVRVDVIEKSSLQNQKFLYRVGKKAFSGSSQSLSFDDWTNAAEVALGTWKSWP